MLDITEIDITAIDQIVITIEVIDTIKVIVISDMANDTLTQINVTTETDSTIAIDTDIN